MKNPAFTLEIKVLLFWGIFILYGSILPFDLSMDPGSLAREWSQAHKIPWRDPQGGLPPLPDAVANVLLFLPWGLLLGLHLSGRGRGALQAMSWGALSAFGMSLFVESVQLFSGSRMTSTTDLVNNAAGGLLGSALGWIVGARLRASTSCLLRRELGRRPLTVLALAVSLGTIFWAVSPYDLSFDVDYLKQSIKLTRLVPFGDPWRGAAPAESPWERVSEMLAWCLIGGVVALAARTEVLSRRRPAAYGLAFVLALAAGTELIQLFVRSRTTDATTILFSSLGAGAGIALVFWMRANRARILPLALAVWGVATLVDGFSPWRFHFPPEVTPEPWRFIPFIHHFLRTDIYALTDTLMQMLLYAPLGALLAARGPASTARQAALTGCAVAAIVELGQLTVEGRTADSTDVVLAGIGAALAVRVWRWALAEGREALPAVATGSGRPSLLASPERAPARPGSVATRSSRIDS